MLKANAVMRRVNKTDEAPPIRALYLDADQIKTQTRAKSRMENLEIQVLNKRWIGRLGNINFQVRPAATKSLVS
jgi:hypothetical protein